MNAPGARPTPPARTGPVARRFGRATAGLAAAWLAVTATGGCATLPALRRAGLTPAYRPDNIHQLARALPADLRRVAVLPVSATSPRADLQAGSEAVTPVLVTELIKTKRFEVVTLSPAVLRARTGRGQWSAAEALPAGFLEIVREQCGCDAVLFAELTEYRAYAPLAVGWRLKLVDARTGLALWAGDELFDARQAAVVAAARQFQGAAARAGGETGGDWAVLHSPRRFAQYSVAQLFDTLPLR